MRMGLESFGHHETKKQSLRFRLHDCAILRSTKDLNDARLSFNNICNVFRGLHYSPIQPLYSLMIQKFPVENLEHSFYFED
jgi:hypothetical protein